MKWYENCLDDEIEQAQNKFNKLLGLSYLGQDWDLINSNRLKLGEFITCYENKAHTNAEKAELMSLILSSLDNYLDKNPNDLSFWYRVQTLLLEDEDLFSLLITYWSDVKNFPNFTWKLTPLVREIQLA